MGTADTESIDNRSSTSQPLPLHRHVQAAVSTHPRRSEASIQTAVGRARETRTLKRRLTGGATVGPLTVYYAPPSTPLRPSSSPSSVVNVGPPYPRILLPTLALSLPSIHIHTAMSDSNGTSTNLKRARSSSPVNGSTSPGGKKQNTGSASTERPRTHRTSPAPSDLLGTLVLPLLTVLQVVLPTHLVRRPLAREATEVQPVAAPTTPRPSQASVSVVLLPRPPALVPLVPTALHLQQLLQEARPSRFTSRTSSSATLSARAAKRSTRSDRCRGAASRSWSCRRVRELELGRTRGWSPSPV